MYNSFYSDKNKKLCLECKKLRENGTYDYPPGWVPFKKRHEVKGKHNSHNSGEQDDQDSRSIDFLVNIIVSTLNLNSKNDQDSRLLPPTTSNRVHNMTVTAHCRHHVLILYGIEWLLFFK